jgi:hypothetical protein
VTIRRWRHLVPFPTRKPIDVACSGGEPSETGGSMRQFHVSKAFLTAFFPFLAIAVTSAVTPDPRLLPLVPPGAPIVAGMNAPPPQGQPDSFVLVTHNNTADLADFFALSGADDSRIIHQVILVAAADSNGGLGEHSLLVSGHFDQARIYRSAGDRGVSVFNYRGLTGLVVQPFAREHGRFNEVRWLAVLDSNILLFGTTASVQQELDRHLAHSEPDPLLMQKLARLHRDDETWCVLSLPAQNVEIRNALWALDPKLADLVQKGDAFQFGIRYGRHIEFEYEVNTASSRDTQTISDSLAQTLVGPQATGSSLLPPPDMNRDGASVHNVVRISRAQYDAWLAAVLARNRVRFVSDLSRR